MSKAKHLIEKVKTKAEMFLVSLTIMLLNVQNVFADVKPDEQGLKDLAAPYIRVGINIGLWALPGCCIFYMLRVAIKWFTSTEEEQQHHNPASKIKRALIILIVGEMIMAILKALGVGEVSY
ncbi:hypothetical protein [Faecalibacillus intestinalis]|jgi:hypothetical protein|uniref:hypothetical protein n=1 Tax=Faecalibacillus intestinalis TaxID=1982626 RepID=UPI0022E23BE1|nr:hypothetical protein [Faecalibacillus intestinalis]